jgi:hypothetical protein
MLFWFIMWIVKTWGANYTKKIAAELITAHVL